jgi:large conductance mechanosensitive channel
MAGVKGFVEEFKAFILRGNVLDLAVAVIIGVAFGAVVEAFTDGILMALIAAMFGEPNFDDIAVHLGDGRILIGAFLTALVNFLLIAFALFLVIKAAARLTPRKPEPAEEAPVPSDEALLLSEIRDLLRAGASGTGRRRPPPS